MNGTIVVKMDDTNGISTVIDGSTTEGLIVVVKVDELKGTSRVYVRTGELDERLELVEALLDGLGAEETPTDEEEEIELADMELTVTEETSTDDEPEVKVAMVEVEPPEVKLELELI